MKNQTVRASLITLVGVGAFLAIGCNDNHQALGQERDRSGSMAQTQAQTEARPGNPVPQGSTPQTSTPSEQPRVDVRAEHAGEIARAVDRLYEARCDRENACGHVGAGQTFGSADACRSKAEEDWHEELNLLSCPSGIDETALNACLSGIQSNACDTSFKRVGQISACAFNKLCNGQGTQGK